MSLPRITEVTSASGMAAFEAKRRAKYLKNSCAPVRFARFPYADLDLSPRARAQCDVFLENFIEDADEGRGLLLRGRPGRGKTAAAVGLMTAALTQASHLRLGKSEESYPMRPGYFLSYPELIYQHKASWDASEENAEHAKDLLRSLYGRQSRDHWNTRILVLDDIGKEHSGGSGFTSATLYDLLRRRYYNGLPTLLTTNLDDEDIEHAYGDAMASFMQEAFEIVEISGPDRRRQREK